MGRPLNRAGAVPRSVMVLTLLLLVAVGALFLARKDKSTADFTLGGPLFPVEQKEIEGLLVTRQGEQFRLDRTAGGAWTLSGAVADYVDRRAVSKLLDNLTSAVGGPLLPGTEVEDRRYEFNGPGAIRLTVFLADGRDISLALGTANPVAGHYYASGAGRDACFQVPASLRLALGQLPASVQAPQLLPQFDRDRIDRVDLRRGGRDFRMERRQGRWWIMMPAEGPAYLGGEVRDYQAMYTDRRITDDQGDWILASTAAMELLIYEVSEVNVRGVKSPVEGAGLLEAWDLDPPWRRVVLTGQGLNPDPSADSPDRLTIAFGPALDQNTVPALRRGNVLITDNEALQVLEQPVGILAHRTALTFLAMKADKLELRREGRLLLRGERTAVAKTTDGRTAWVTLFPPADQPGQKGVDRSGMSGIMAVNLDRIPVLAVLPPTKDAAVLADRERVSVTLEFGTGDSVRTEVFDVGYLVENRLPVGSATLVRPDDGSAPAGIWFPASGKLLQVSGQLIVTARNMLAYVPPEAIE